MNKIKYILFTALVSSMMVFTSCSDFLDVNDSPTQIKEASMASLLGPVIERTARANSSAMKSANRVTHQLDHVGGYYSTFTMGSNWINSYLYVFPNLQKIQDQAENSPHYSGVAKVLEAINVGMLADVYESAPYSEANLGSANISPKYDNQQSLYGNVQSLLDAAIPLLEKEDSFLSPGEDDLAYGGDMSKWVKLAHSLKARYMIHLSNKGSVNWNTIAAEAALGITANDENFQLTYNEVNKNPIHVIAIDNLTGNLTYTFGKMYIDLMNGTSYGVFDPRLPSIAISDSSYYAGLAQYDDESEIHTTEIGTDGWYSSASSPFIMFSAAEGHFIMAEAGLNGAGDADASYRAGISAHMEMLGVDGTDYMADPAVDVVADLEHIMKEKMIATIFNMESWNDMRRHNFDETVFKGFVNVNNSTNPEIERDGPAQRALYPASEFSRNEENATANFKEIDVVMWKDQ